MHSCHAKSCCCRAKIYHFGSRRCQCCQCKRTWRIRKKQRGRKPRRTRPGLVQAVLLDGRTLKTLAPRYGLTHQVLSRRFRRALRQFVSISGFALAQTLGFALGRTLFPLSRKRLGLVCDGAQAVPSKSSRLPRSGASARQRKPAGLVSGNHNDPRLYTQTHPGLGLRRDFWNYQAVWSQGWIVQLCHFHLISRLQNCRGRRNRRLEGRPLREALYQHVRQALESPDGPRLQTVLKKLRHLVRQATGLRVMRMIVREFLRRIDHFRAYRKYPKLNLPTTTGSVEAMNRRVRDLMRQTRSTKSPHVLHLWATALIRTRPMVMCNGKHFSTK